MCEYSAGLVTYSQSIIHRGLRMVRIACERIRINYCRVVAAMRTVQYFTVYAILQYGVRIRINNALRVTAVRIVLRTNRNHRQSMILGHSDLRYLRISYKASRVNCMMTRMTPAPASRGRTGTRIELTAESSRPVSLPDN